jgi:hypothetical protein
MRVADLRLGPPPRAGETARGGQARRGGPDERIDLVKDAETLRRASARLGYRRVNGASAELASFAGACLTPAGRRSVARHWSPDTRSRLVAGGPLQNDGACTSTRYTRVGAAAAGSRYAGVAQWQSSSLPSWSCGFDSRHPLHPEGPGQPPLRRPGPSACLAIHASSCDLRAISSSKRSRRSPHPTPRRPRGRSALPWRRRSSCPHPGCCVGRSAPRACCRVPSSS